MSNIYYNSTVAKMCGKNGIIKAVLLNYIYNYHKQNPRKGAGYPAKILLGEFVYQYAYEDKSVWKRSFIHKILTDLCRDKHLSKTQDNGVPVYSVSSEVADLLTDESTPLVCFELKTACEYGIHIAIMERYLKHIITKSPKGVAYNLNVEDMAKINRLSPAQIYRAIKHLVDKKVLARVKMRSQYCSRALSLALYNPRRLEFLKGLYLK